MVRVSVEVRLKKGVTDPEGDNVAKALKLLGFQGVKGVHVSKVFLIELQETDGKAARKAAEEMCKRMLANPVIHDYEIRVEA